MKATRILISKNIFDCVDNAPKDGAIVLNDNEIVGVYTRDEIDQFKCEDIVDFGDKLITPGFIDSHTHSGNFLETVDPNFCVSVAGSKSIEEVMATIIGFGERNPEALLYAVNFNFFDLEDKVVPTAKVIDSYISDRPVIIMTWDCHNWYANTKAIEMAGMTELDKDAHNYGELSDTMSYPIQKLLVRPIAERRKSLKLFLGDMNSYGITTVGDVFPCGLVEPYELYKSAEEEKELTARICFYPSLLDYCTEEDVERFRRDYCSDMLRFGGLKSILDGVLTVHTAWMLKPYSNKTNTCGGPVIDKADLRKKILKACSMGVCCRIHAIGDAAIRYSLDCFEEAKKKYGSIGKYHNIEHIEYCDPEDIPRFKENGVAANMHLRHCVFYIDDAIDYLGKERIEHCFMWRNMLESGAVMGTGSDYPVVHYNPMCGVYAGITRAHDDGTPEGGWLPEQKLTLAETIKLFTIGSATAMNIEEIVGTLEKGKKADIVVWDRNLFDSEPKEILEARPVTTIVDGKTVYQTV